MIKKMKLPKEVTDALKENALDILEEKDLPVYLELQSLGEKMDSKSEQDKEMHEEMMGCMEEMKNKEMPDVQKVEVLNPTDFTETNTLLKQLLDKENEPEKPVEITVKLNLV